MQLARARIQNFRSLKAVSVEIGNHTALIGGNGAGKSSILKALERFFSTAKSLDIDDFFGRSVHDPVEIELTFTDLTDDEREAFHSRVRDGKLIITRIFDSSANSGRYYGSTLINPDFEQIRVAQGAMAKRTAYAALKQTPKYAGLEPATNQAAVEQGMIKWENDHPDQLQLGRDDGQFFGFQNASRTAIGRYISFVFVPAVREAAADASDGKASAIGRLLELLVRSAILKRKDIVAWREKVNAEYKDLTSPGNMPELGELAKRLTVDLKTLYQDASVGLDWRDATDMAVPLPTADVTLTDVGFGGPVDRQGHGLQRAFIFTLLQQLARASVPQPESEEAAAPLAQSGNSTQSEAASIDLSNGHTAVEVPVKEAQTFAAPGLIIAIEEPELYQHPTKQRHFSSVLRGLSNGTLPGADGRTQVAFASHSPMFVSVPNVADLRFVRRVDCEGSDFKQCELQSLDLDKVAAKLEASQQKPKGTFTAATLLPRLHILGPELAEGFFADGIVLVEGRSDKAALYAAASLSGLSFEGEGIAVLPVDGKGNLDRPLLIFRELGIPTYAIWDCDFHKGAEGNPGQNICLRRACKPDELDVDQPDVTMIGDGFAHLSHTLEITLRSEIGEPIYTAARDAACKTFDINPSKDAEKNPEVMKRLLETAAEHGAKSITLEKIVRSIWLYLKNVDLPATVSA